MEEAFEKLKKEGKNDVDHLVQWMKDSKIIDKAKASEEKTKALFKDAANKSNIEIEKFKQVLTKLAEEQNKSLEDLSKCLETEGNRLMGAFKAAASAFKDALKK